jgi:hypothetical protein
MPVSADHLRLNLQNSLAASGVSVDAFSYAAGFSKQTSVSRFLQGTNKWTARKVLARIEDEMRRRGWLEGGEQSAPASEPAATSPTPVEKPAHPYPDLAEDDPRHTYKLIVNSLAAVLATQPDLSDEDRREIEQEIKKSEEMIAAPPGYYPWSSLFDANPVNKLTRDQKLHCIRTLPLDIVSVLFPTL